MDLSVIHKYFVVLSLNSRPGSRAGAIQGTFSLGMSGVHGENVIDVEWALPTSTFIPGPKRA